ncbi:MAG: hypothetical protein Q8P02_00530, partial [Candidatus Micrarchaeota archaeon]|nr:hypothetical protein [Candidatus Micrarchaeota archaeon]
TDEHLLSDNDRKGLRVLARCISQKAPVGLLTAYAERGDFPPETYLRSLKCVADAPHGSLDHLQANWAAMGHAIVGHNILLRSPYKGTPSRVYDIIRATDTHLAQEAADAITATDEFVNAHVAGIKESLKNRISFKGATGLPREQRLELAYALEKRFLVENDARIQNVANLKSYAAGLDSCALGEVMGVGTGAVAAPVLRAAGKLPGGWKAVGTIAVVGLSVYGLKQTTDSATRLITSYRDIPLNEKISEICGLVSEAIEIGPDLADTWKALRAKGSKVKADEPSVVPQADAPADARKVETNAQAETPTQARAAKQVEGSHTPEGLDQKATAWVEAPEKPISGGPIPDDGIPTNVQARKKAQKTLEENGADLPAKVAEQEKPKLDELRQKELTGDPTIIHERINAENDANGRLLEAADPERRAQYTTHADEPALTYVPKNKASASIPARIYQNLKKFLDTAKEKLKTLTKVKTTEKNTVFRTPADYAQAIRSAKKSGERMELLRDAFGRPAVGAGGKSTTVLRKTVLTEFRATLNPKETATFDGIINAMYNPGTLAEEPEGFDKAVIFFRDNVVIDQRGLSAEQIKDAFEKSAYDSTFARDLLVGLDPDLRRFAVAGDDNRLVNAIVQMDQAKNLEQGFVFSKALRQAAKDGKPVLDETELDHMVELSGRLGYASTDESKALVRERAEFFSQNLPAAWKDAFQKAAKKQEINQDIADIAKTSVDEKGSGAFRTAYLEQHVFEGNPNRVTELVKVGKTVDGEFEVTERYSKFGVAPEPHALVKKVEKKQQVNEKGEMVEVTEDVGKAIFYQEYIQGKPLKEILAGATEAEKEVLLAEIAEMDAIIAIRGAVIDTDGKIRIPFISDGDTH